LEDGGFGSRALVLGRIEDLPRASADSKHATSWKWHVTDLWVPAADGRSTEIDAIE